MTTGTLGPTASGVPWRKLSIALAIIAVVGIPLGFGTARAITKDRQDRNAEHRSQCVAVPEMVQSAIRAGLANLEGREVVGWGATRSTTGAVAGSWFVSVELRLPTAPKDSIGDIATFLVPDAAGAPSLGGFVGVDRNAHDYAAWPPAPPTIYSSEDGGIESRFCAMDSTREPLR